MGAPELREPNDAGHVTLVPAGPLAGEAPVTLDSLLIDVCIARRRDPPTRCEQPQAEVEILGERRTPRHALESHESGEPGELPIAAEADRAGQRAGELGHGRDHPELHVLELGDEPATVANPYRELHRPHPGVVEEGQRRAGAARAQSPVGVHHRHNHPIRVQTPPPHIAEDQRERCVEGRALAQSCIGPTPDEYAKAVGRAQGGGRPRRVRRGGILGVVVDHDHRAGRVAQKASDGGGHHRLLVQAGDEEVDVVITWPVPLLSDGCPCLLAAQATALATGHPRSEEDADHEVGQSHGEHDLGQGHEEQLHGSAGPGPGANVGRPLGHEQYAGESQAGKGGADQGEN